MAFSALADVLHPQSLIEEAFASRLILTRNIWNRENSVFDPQALLRGQVYRYRVAQSLVDFLCAYHY